MPVHQQYTLAGLEWHANVTYRNVLQVWQEGGRNEGLRLLFLHRTQATTDLGGTNILLLYLCSELGRQRQRQRLFSLANTWSSTLYH